jgi:hypothetical protein
MNQKLVDVWIALQDAFVGGKCDGGEVSVEVVLTQSVDHRRGKEGITDGGKQYDKNTTELAVRKVRQNKLLFSKRRRRLDYPVTLRRLGDTVAGRSAGRISLR